MAATNEKEKAERQAGDDERAHRKPHHGPQAHRALWALSRPWLRLRQPRRRTGFSEADLALLFEALETMFEHDHSAARGEMSTRKLIVFKHGSVLGKAPAHALFDRVKVCRAVDGALRDLDDKGLGNLPPARKFSDYAVTIDRAGLPEGVEIIEKL